MLEVIKLNNVTKDYTLYATVASSYMQRFLGLRFKRSQNMFFEFRKPTKIFIDMWFVFFPVQIVVMNEYYEVVDIKRKAAPFSFVWFKGKHHYFLELPLKNRVRVSRGDVIRPFNEEVKEDE